jgi:hypothetical protein
VAEVGGVLKSARDLVATRGWCQKVRARDGYGKRQVSHDHERAGQFSVVGAIYRAAAGNEDLRDVALAVLAKAVNESPRPSDIDGWNDEPGRTRAQVIEAFDCAVKIATPLKPEPEKL